jgi:hypothetical protein
MCSSVKQVRVSAVLSNARYLLNLDCDHYINNSKALRESMCFMMDPLLGKRVCYVQFPQRFDGIDRNDRYANRNTVFFDVSIHLSELLDCSLLLKFVCLMENSSFTADQYERFGWHSRTYICRDWMCFQKARALWLWCSKNKETTNEDMQLLA